MLCSSQFSLVLCCCSAFFSPLLLVTGHICKKSLRFSKIQATSQVCSSVYYVAGIYCKYGHNGVQAHKQDAQPHVKTLTININLDICGRIFHLCSLLELMAPFSSHTVHMLFPENDLPVIRAAASPRWGSERVLCVCSQSVRNWLSSVRSGRAGVRREPAQSLFDIQRS